MKKITALCIAVLALACFSNAQLTCTNASHRTLTAYTNGQPNDSLFFICANQTATLLATPPGGTPGWNFAWQQFNVAGNTWNPLATVPGVPMSQQSNLQPGGYRVVITDGTNSQVGAYIVWVCRVNVNPSVNVNNIPAGCANVQLQGQINGGTITPYYNAPALVSDPANSLIVNNQTSIAVCFTGTHSWISDLGFYLVGPTSCGSPTILLSPNPGSNGQYNICNGSDNFTNLCFTNQSTAIFNPCTPGTYSGTYGGYGPGAGTLINWNALNGCDASQAGWAVQVYDCISGDLGALTGASINLSGVSVGGAPITYTYSSPTGFSNPIADNSCTPSTASIFTVPSAPAQIINFPTTFQWTADPPFNIPVSTSSLNINLNPGPTVDTQFTLSLTGNHPGAICGGTSTSTKLFDYVEPTTPVITPPAATTLCSTDGAISLAADIAGGTWSGPGITSAANGTFDPATAGVGTHAVTYSLGGTCTQPATVVFNIIGNAQISISPINHLCSDAAALNLVATPAGGTWSGTGITNGSSGTFDPSIAGVGTQNITYQIGGNCGSTGTATVEVVQSIQANITGPNTVCIDEASVLYEATPSDGSWSGPGIGNTSSGSFNPASAGIGTHTIHYDITGDCTADASITVEVTPEPVVSINVVNPMCTNAGVITLSASPADGTWSGPGITNGTFNPATAGPGTHTITYQTGGTCAASGTTSITVSQFVQPAITGPTSICIDESAVILTATPAGGTWSGTGVSSTGVFNPSTAGIGTYTIDYSVPGNCLQVGSLTVNVVGQTQVVIQPAGPLCTNSSAVTLSANVAGGAWSGPGITNGTTGNFNPISAGVGTHTINYQVSGTCPASGTTTIVINQYVPPVITAPSTLCSQDNPVALSATPTGGTWSGDGVNSSGLFTPAQALNSPAVVTYNSTGTCPGSANANIVVNSNPTTIASNTVAICEGTSTIISASGATTYSWSPSGGLSSSIVANPTASPSNTTTYTVTGTTNGCSSSDQVIITVNSAPNVAVNGPHAICLGDSVQLTMTGLTTFSWDNTATLSSNSVPNPMAFPMNNMTYTVSGTGANGCQGSALVIVTVIDVNFIYSPEEGVKPLEVEFINLSEGSQFFWDFGNGDTETTFSPEPNVNSIYTEEGLYTVTLTSINGTTSCSSTGTVLVYGDSELRLVPNIVTSDGSGKNDNFAVETIAMRSLDVKIYDSWGKHVGDLKSPTDYWNPRDNPSGTYYYILKAEGLDGTKYERGGYFTVVR